MDKRIQRDIQQRGELLGSHIRSGGHCEGAGTGCSPLTGFGMPLSGGGNDSADLSMMIAVETLERVGEPRIRETIAALDACAPINSKAVDTWIFHYVSDGNLIAKASQRKVSRSKYLELICKAEHMLAVQLGV